MTSQSWRKYLDYIVDPEVRQYCGPVFFTSSLEIAVGNVTANGSLGLVDTGIKKLLVTCFHVWDEFQKARLQNPELKMCLCLDPANPVVFAPSGPLGEDSKLDIATFDMDSLLPACGGRKFYPLYQNPPRRVEVRDKLFFIGFPGHLRVESPEFIQFGRAPFATGVSSVSDFRFLSDTSNLRYSPKQFGGISGCPCFLVREDRPIHLVGFATSFMLSNLQFVHARCLRPDGTISTG